MTKTTQTKTATEFSSWGRGEQFLAGLIKALEQEQAKTSR